MFKAAFRSLAGAVVLMAPLAMHSEPAVVGLARAYLGPDSTLDSLKTIRFVGTLDHVENTPGAVVQHYELDMVFEKPLRQHLAVRSPKVTMTTVLDGYDGWDWLQDNTNPAKHRLLWLQLPDIRTLRANTWENLYYFKLPENGTIEDKGTATVDGIECQRVDFDHGAGILYQRYFDRDTGRLVMTVLGRESFKEEGEMRVGGVRFPKKIISTINDLKGGSATETATFMKIVLNEDLPDSLFARPSEAPAK